MQSKQLLDVLNTAKTSQLTLSYCQHLLCTKILVSRLVVDAVVDEADIAQDQASNQVASHIQSCFGFAAVVVVISAKFPAFRDVFLAYSQAACPYNVPRYVQHNGIRKSRRPDVLERPDPLQLTRHITNQLDIRKYLHPLTSTSRLKTRKFTLRE